MPKFRSSGLSLPNDFAVLRRITSTSLRAHRWQKKNLAESVDKIRYIIGIDEVANGALAGPFVVAGCCFTAPFEPNDILRAVRDSKKVVPNHLVLMNDALENEPSIVYERVSMDNDEVDRQRNITKSKLTTWANCIHKLSYKVYATQLSRLTADDMCNPQVIKQKGVITDFDEFLRCIAVIVDGQEEANLPRGTKYPAHIYSVPKADGIFYTVAAASILAKHCVDKLMEGEFHRRYVEYNFKKNKGYGTLEHRNILRQIGPCKIHRRTFITNIWNDVMQKA